MNPAPALIRWYRSHKRDLPWRDTSDPYAIWLSEVILQQTRVDQGLAYYLRFLERFPDVKSLANAPEQDVLRLWQGLGYYSRARNLLATARIIRDE
ncbi:MAG: A/G-specific adenine glycosylase, partial [Phycisphaerae bacterium]